MKSSKFLTITSVLLCIIMLFTSCSSVGSIKDILNENYDGDNYEYKKATALSEFNGAEFQSSSAELVVFQKNNNGKTEYIVYNIDQQKKVWSQTESSSVSLYIELSYLYVDDEYISYFTVYETTTKKGSTQTETMLFTASGSEVASVDSQSTPVVVCDLIYFGGKMYRVSSNGNIEFAFDYSPLAKIPSVVMKYKDIYYAEDDGLIETYNSNLEPLAKYSITESASGYELVVLKNGNILIQSHIRADSMSDDYTVLVNGVKYDIVTKIINAKNGKEKNVKCDYIIEYALDSIGSLDFEESHGLAQIYTINDKRIDTEKTVCINNRGKAKELGSIDDDKIVSQDHFAENRWILYTESEREYLVDEKCNVIGDVTNANTNGEFFICENKIYDKDLEEIYDLTEKKQSIYGTVGNSLLLQGEDGEVTLLTQNGTKELIAKDSEKSLISCLNNCIIIENYDTSSVEIYSHLGKLISEVEDVYSRAYTVSSCDGSLLLYFNSDRDFSKVYYLLSK